MTAGFTRRRTDSAATTDRCDAPSHPLLGAGYDPMSRRTEETVVREHRKYLAGGLGGRVLDPGGRTGRRVYRTVRRRGTPAGG